MLVRENELDDLIRSAEICSLLWGGIYNPIIPMNAENNEAAIKLLQLYQVDALYPVSASVEILSFIKSHSYLNTSPFTSTNGLLTEDWRTKKNELAWLDSLHCIEKLAGAQPKLRNFLSVSWDEKDKRAALFALQFGTYPKDLNLKYDFGAAFNTALEPQIIHIFPNDDLAEKWQNKNTPINITRADIQSYGRSHDGAFIGNPENFRDLVFFWNLRAAGNDISFISIDEPKRFFAYLKAHISEIDAKPNSHPNIEDRITFFYSGKDDDANSVVQLFTTKKKKALARVQQETWNGLNTKPTELVFSWETAIAHIDDRNKSYSATIILPDRKFLPSLHQRSMSQLFAARVVPLAEFGYPGHTLKLPYKPELARDFGRKCMSASSRFRLGKGHFSVLISAHDNSVTVNPIAKKDIVKQVISASKAVVEDSQAGLLADRLLEKLDGVDGTRVFKIRGVRKLIDELAVEESITRSEATNLIWNERQFLDHETLYIEQRDTEKLTPEQVFSHLLRHGFFRAGLNLQCTQCRLDSWLSLRQIDDIWVCEFCGHANNTSLHLKHRGDWKFRKSGLLAKDNNQEGALPVLLSLLAFRRVLSSDEVYSTSLLVQFGDRRCEVDYAILSYSDESIECVLGEAKSTGGAIDENDIKNLILIRNQLEDSGIRTYLSFSKAADKFTSTELQLFHELHRDNVPMILMTNNELEPYEPYEGRDTTPNFPHMYPTSFSDMSDNSAFLYLSLSQP